MKLGIDFGTTRTVVAAAVDGRYPVASFDVGDRLVDHIPGIAALTDDGAASYGWAALDRLRGPNPPPAIRSIKRLVAQLVPDEPVAELGPAAPTALELTTAFLRHVARMLREHSNLDILPSEPLEAVIAVPANASTRQRYLTVEAFARAGFVVRGMISEPTAAAIELAQRKLANLGARSPKRYVVVYDLGGGTFDTSAVSLEGRRFALLTSEGFARLGGDDFDEVIAELAMERANLTCDPSSRAALLEVCREAKETLTPKSKKLMVDLEPLGAEPVVLDAAAIYDACQPLIDRTIALVQEVFGRLHEYGIDPENPRELGGLYLVGGAIAFPPVARALRATYNRKIILAPQPHAATAVGLAVAADPAASIFVREAITRHFGVWRESESGRQKIFDRILSKDTATSDEPLVIRRVYHPHHTVGSLRFLECAALDDEGQPAGDVTPWTRVFFPYDPQLANRGELGERDVATTERVAAEEIAETYIYGLDGTVEVAIENLTSGYARRFVLGSLR